MTAKKCKCHPDSPFLWAKNPRPSIFVQDKHGLSETLSRNQTVVVEKMRTAGVDISHIPGISSKDHAKRLLDVKQFTIYSRAG